jgi:hypothetical protein
VRIATLLTHNRNQAEAHLTKPAAYGGDSTAFSGTLPRPNPPGQAGFEFFLLSNIFQARPTAAAAELKGVPKGCSTMFREAIPVDFHESTGNTIGIDSAWGTWAEFNETLITILLPIPCLSGKIYSRTVGCPPHPAVRASFNSPPSVKRPISPFVSRHTARVRRGRVYCQIPRIRL